MLRLPPAGGVADASPRCPRAGAVRPPHPGGAGPRPPAQSVRQTQERAARPRPGSGHRRGALYPLRAGRPLLPPPARRSAGVRAAGAAAPGPAGPGRRRGALAAHRPRPPCQRRPPDPRAAPVAGAHRIEGTPGRPDPGDAGGAVGLQIGAAGPARQGMGGTGGAATGSRRHPRRGARRAGPGRQPGTARRHPRHRRRRGLPALPARRRHRQRQNRSLPAGHGAGARRRQTGADAGAGNRPDAANPAPLPAALRGAGDGAAFRTHRPRTPGRLGGRPGRPRAHYHRYPLGGVHAARPPRADHRRRNPRRLAETAGRLPLPRP